MLNTKPSSRVGAGAGVSRTRGAFVASWGLDGAAGGLQKFRIGKVIERYPSVAENFSLLLQN